MVSRATHHGHRLFVLLMTLAALTFLLMTSSASAAASVPPAPMQSLVFALDLGAVAAEQQSTVLAQTVQVFNARLGALGVGAPDVRSGSDDSLVVSVPGDVDLPEVCATLNGRGIVEFREQDESGLGWKPLIERDDTGEFRPLTSAYFTRRSRVEFDRQFRQPLVAFEFDDDGARLFEAATRRLLGQPLAIFYDERLVAAPHVQSVISREGVIAGLSETDARRLTIQLNSGSLPVYVTIRP
jgi:preprotein translocase subunit SecD